MSDGEDDLFVHDDSYDPDKAGFQILFAVMQPLSANKLSSGFIFKPHQRE